MSVKMGRSTGMQKLGSICYILLFLQCQTRHLVYVWGFCEFIQVNGAVLMPRRAELQLHPRYAAANACPSLSKALRYIQHLVVRVISTAC